MSENDSKVIYQKPIAADVSALIFDSAQHGRTIILAKDGSPMLTLDIPTASTLAETLALLVDIGSQVPPSVFDEGGVEGVFGEPSPEERSAEDEQLRLREEFESRTTGSLYQGDEVPNISSVK